MDMEHTKWFENGSEVHWNQNGHHWYERQARTIKASVYRLAAIYVPRRGSWINSTDHWRPFRACKVSRSYCSTLQSPARFLFDRGNVPMYPNVLLRDPMEFTFPSDMWTVMTILISISFTAIFKSFCVFHIHCPFRDSPLQFRLVCRMECECTVWRWRLSRVQDRYWSLMRNVYVVCWFRFL